MEARELVRNSITERQIDTEGDFKIYIKPQHALPVIVWGINEKMELMLNNDIVNHNNNPFHKLLKCLCIGYCQLKKMFSK